MKNLKLTMVCLGLALTAMVVSEADAGVFKKDGKKARTEKSEEMSKPARHDNYPSMKFVGGILSRDMHSGWKIGETPLYLHQDCVISGSEEDGSGGLEEGRHATVMGAPVGGAINAYSIYVSSPSYKSIGLGGSQELKEPGPNPSVGVITNPAE
jgi:hypothetical protein